MRDGWDNSEHENKRPQQGGKYRPQHEKKTKANIAVWKETNKDQNGDGRRNDSSQCSTHRGACNCEQ